MRTNSQLRELYDNVYRKGEDSFFTTSSIEEELAIQRCESWTGKRVLEIGCRTGRLATLLAMSGAERVDAIDYSAEAISLAEDRVRLPNLHFACMDCKDVASVYDVVVMQGVLEHMDDPFATLLHVMDRIVCHNGCCVTSSPCFVNPRGYVWMALATLLNVPMSLSDLHFLSPWQFRNFAEDYGYQCDFKTIEHDWAAGKQTITDFAKRLPNALRDAGCPVDGVASFLGWLDKAIHFDHSVRHGAIAVYRISK